MAVFGFQFTYTAILSVVLQKIVPIYSPGLKLLTGYYRFIVPSEESLKKFTSNSNKNSKDLRIPNDVEIELQMHKTNRNDVAFLPFFSDFTWLVDFCLMTIFCFLGTEIYFQLGFNETAVLHMGLIWILIVFYLTIGLLLRMVRSYVQSKSGELSVVLSLTSAALVLSMLFLISDKYFEYGLDASFKNFNGNLKNFYKKISGDSEKQLLEDYTGPPALIVNSYLAITSTILACLLTFPGLKSAQMFSLLFKRKGATIIDQTLACLNLSLPFVVTLLYLKPVKAFYMDPDHFTLKPSDRVGSGDSVKNLSDDEKEALENSFKLFRVSIILALCLLRVLTFKSCMQEFQLTPKKELDEIRKEVGYTKVAKIQDEIKKVNLSTCITAVQYITPTIIVGFLTLFLVGAGDIKFLPSFKNETDSFLGKLITAEATTLNKESIFLKFSQKYLGNSDFLTTKSVKGVSLTALLEIFNPVLLNGLVNYLLWFTCFFLSLTSVLGWHFYYKRYTENSGAGKNKLTTSKVKLASDVGAGGSNSNNKRASKKKQS